MKNSTVSSGKSRSKISSVGVGHPRNRRKMAIIKSMASPAITPAMKPQVSVLSQWRRSFERGDELGILKERSRDPRMPAAFRKGTGTGSGYVWPTRSLHVSLRETPGKTATYRDVFLSRLRG